MATYDQGQQIKNADVVDLLTKINTVLARTGGMDASSFTTYKNNLIPISPNNSVSANAGTSAVASQASALYIIQHLLKGGYMNVSSSQQTAATALINQTYPTAGTLMYALTNAYTVVNYWNSGNSEASHYGCNGACVGYCTGTCGGGATLGSGMCSSCWASCATTCSNSCTGSCNDDCRGGSKTACGSCNGNCYGSCSASCARNCWGCQNACSGGCAGGCSSGCGTSCQGKCTFSSNAH